MLEYGARMAKDLLARSDGGEASDAGARDNVVGRGAAVDGVARGGAQVLELVGDVGSGKTTFTRGLAQGLCVQAEVTSPSFTISKAYALPGGGRLTHYDFYRLGDPGLMVDDLAENLADPQSIVVIEWGESIQDVLPAEHIRLMFRVNDDGSREVEVQNDARENETQSTAHAKPKEAEK